MKKKLTAERLRELLAYDPATGIFTWRVKTSYRVEVGDVAGCRTDGYVKIQVDGSKYLAHRLAWLHEKGVWPERELDHRNGDGFDNHFTNLRPATRSSNMQNQRRAKSNNTTKLLGANRQGEGFQAMINIDGKPTYIGYFDTAEAAHAAYVAAKRKHHSGCTI